MAGRGVPACRIQLALDVQLPEEYGGLGGQAIYIGAPPPCALTLPSQPNSTMRACCAERDGHWNTQSLQPSMVFRNRQRNSQHTTGRSCLLADTCAS